MYVLCMSKISISTLQSSQVSHFPNFQWQYRCGMWRFPLFLNALQGSFTMFAHSILPHGLRGMAKLAILRNPHSVPFCPPLWLALCDVK